MKTSACGLFECAPVLFHWKKKRDLSPAISRLQTCLYAQEYKRKQLEEQRQSERLQRQLQQEHAYLVSLQQQQQEKKPQLYHYNKNLEANNKPAWAREVAALRTFEALNIIMSS